MSAVVVVLLGTDHHPFDRLVDWSDVAAAELPDARLVVQHGWTRAPAVAEGRPFLPHDELLDLLAAADGVVCHGGPGTIMDARGAGHVPVCVPRDPRLGEHVDGHQQRFAGLVAATGVVRTVDSERAFVAAVRDFLSGRAAACATADADGASTDRARTLLVAELDELLHRPEAPVARWRRRFLRAAG